MVDLNLFIIVGNFGQTLMEFKFCYSDLCKVSFRKFCLCEKYRIYIMFSLLRLLRVEIFFQKHCHEM